MSQFFNTFLYEMCVPINKQLTKLLNDWPTLPALSGNWLKDILDLGIVIPLCKLIISTQTQHYMFVYYDFPVTCFGHIF